MVRRRQFTGRTGHRRLGGRPRGVWVALGVGVLGVVVSVVVLISVIGLIGSGEGVTGGMLRVPVGKITLVVVLGYLITLALLVLTATSRSLVRAWVSAVIACVVSLIVSVYPLVATATAAVSQAHQVLPFIADLIHRVAG